jgi:hypothetical protein
MFEFEDLLLSDCDSSSREEIEEPGVYRSARTVLATIMLLVTHTKVTIEAPCIEGRLPSPFTTRVRVDSSVDH